MTMRTTALALQVILVGTVAFAQQAPPPVAGTWEGALEVGAVKLRIGVTIVAQADGTLSATMDSPDQGAYGMPLNDVSLGDGVLKFALRRANGTFEGRLNATATEISGTWTQGMPLPLVLKRVEKPTRPNRPQEPKPPFPYRAEDVTIPNAPGQAVLAGTLTIPEGTGPFPAVVLISGSGPQNRDEEKTTARIVERLQAIPVPGPKEASAAFVKQSSSPWFRFFATYDPAAALTKVRCPVLALAGELDLQVLPAQNLPAIRAALKQGGNRHHTVLELPGLNHLFQSARTGLPSEYGQIEETVAPAALDRITAWIQEQTGLAR